MTKPLLLIDVDGVLNPFGMGLAAPGFTTHRLLGYNVRLNPEHGEMLLDCTDTFDLVWATTWQHDANKLIGPIIGLPELPVIEFPHWSSKWITWKMEGIISSPLLHGKRFAWLDDDLHADAWAWQQERAISIPTHFEWIDPRFGLTKRHIDSVREWEQNNV